MKILFPKILPPLLFTLVLLANLPVVSAQAQESNNHLVTTSSASLWAINSSSYLEINGSTNVNQFTCELNSESFTDTLQLKMVYDETNINLKQSQIKVNVHDFHCHNPLITKDFRTTLKADEHPYISIFFIGLKLVPDLNIKETSGTIRIVIAGVPKDYDIKYQLQKTESQNYLLKGSQSLTFGDFNLTPPSRLLNMIKVKDEIDIFFQLELQHLQ